jgi:hypothetical protein
VRPAPGWTDQVIADALEVHPTTVARVRQHHATAGLGAALDRKVPEREYRRKLDGEQEARLAVLACSTPPEGHKRWTLRLLAQERQQPGSTICQQYTELAYRLLR